MSIDIRTNASQATAVIIRDMGILVPASGSSSITLSTKREIFKALFSQDLLDLATDDAHGANSSTIILNNGSIDISQDQVEEFLKAKRSFVAGTLVSNNELLVSSSYTGVNDNIHFGTLEDAITRANALSPSTSNRIVIRIGPGDYTENNPLTVPSFVSIIGKNTRIFPTDNNQALFELLKNTNIQGVQAVDVDGSGGIGFNFNAGVAETATLIECTANNCSIGFQILGDPSANITVINCLSLFCGDAYKIGSGGGQLIFAGSGASGSTGHDLNVVDSDGFPQGAASLLDSSKISIADNGRHSLIHSSIIEGDDGIRVIGELSVGTHRHPAEVAFGGGNHHIIGLSVKRNTNLEAGTWSDITDEMESFSGSTASMFPGSASGNAIYVGGDIPFPNINVELDSAMDIGSGSLETEFWNGSSWESVPVLSVDENTLPQFGNDILTRGTDEHIRFGDVTGWATKTLDGVNKYWFRIRISSAITTIPVAQRIKLGVDAFEIDANGVATLFGSARQTRVLNTRLSSSYPIASFNPLDNNIDVTNILEFIVTNNQLPDGDASGVGDIIIIPEGIDTSLSIQYEVLWAPVTGATGDVELALKRSLFKVGSVLDGSNPETDLFDVTTISSGVADKTYRTTFSFIEPTAVPGDMLALAIGRNANAGNADDTLSSDIYIVSVRASARFWR